MRKFTCFIILMLIIAMGIAQLSCTGSNNSNDPSADPGSNTTPSISTTTTSATTTQPTQTTTTPQTEDKDPVKLEYDSSVPKAQVQVKGIYLIDEPSTFSDKLTLATLQGLISNKCEDQIVIKNASFDNFKYYLFNTWKCHLNT